MPAIRRRLQSLRLAIVRHLITQPANQSRSTRATMAAMRYHFLDNLRGLTFISMAFFHTMWDLVYLFGVNVSWFSSPVGYVWQQSILWTFVLLSGFCCGLSRHQLKRGVIVFGAGALVTLITVIAMPQDAVFFGVLTFLGAAMIVIASLKPYLEKFPALPALLACLVLFVVTRDIPFGYLGFEQFHIVELPGELYANWATTAFGFQFPGFSSTDYVPFLPWIFLYLAGYFLFRAFPRHHKRDADGSPRQVLALPQQRPWPVADFIGRHCLGFYLIHQVAIFAVLSVIFAII